MTASIHPLYLLRTSAQDFSVNSVVSGFLASRPCRWIKSAITKSSSSIDPLEPQTSFISSLFESCPCKSIKNIFRFSRRYSVVVTETALLLLNSIFLYAKVVDNDEWAEITLALLSTIGVASLHYYTDLVWKAVQDAVFAVKRRNFPITALATLKTVQAANNVALTLGNFTAAMQGVTGHEEKQALSYQRMILWGEVSLGVGLCTTLLSLLATWIAKRKIAKGELATDPHTVAYVRFSMDKDTLWHLSEKLENIGLENLEELEAVIEVVKQNIDTQIKVTMGGHLILIIAGDVLLAIEKAYTPNSLVSAVINCAVSFAYAGKISIEKGMEYCQRARLDEIKQKEDIPSLL